MTNAQLMPPLEVKILKIGYPFALVCYLALAIDIWPIVGLTNVILLAMFLFALVQYAATVSDDAKQHFAQFCVVFAIGLVAYVVINSASSLAGFYLGTRAVQLGWAFGFGVTIWQMLKTAKAYRSFLKLQTLPAFHLI